MTPKEAAIYSAVPREATSPMEPTHTAIGNMLKEARLVTSRKAVDVMGRSRLACVEPAP